MANPVISGGNNVGDCLTNNGLHLSCVTPPQPGLFPCTGTGGTIGNGVPSVVGGISGNAGTGGAGGSSNDNSGSTEGAFLCFIQC